MGNEPIDLTNLGQQTPQPAHDPLPPVKRSRASILIAIIVSALFLLGAAGIAAWMYWQKQSTTPVVVQPKDNTSTKDVKRVTWVPPKEIPASYVKQDASTHQAATTDYYDDTTVCGLTSTVTPVADTNGATAKEAVTNLTKAGAMAGVAIETNADGDNYTLTDTDGHEYTFDSMNISQTVNVQNINFTKQQNVVVYKQFGSELAVITATCKQDTWDTKKPELLGLLKQFTVKLER